MASEIEKHNKAHSTECLTPTCGSDGRCTYESLPIPSSMPFTKCMKPECQKQSDKSWKWVYVPTAVNLSCKSDACSYRQCRNEADPNKFPDGCYWEDICLNRTTECEYYSCDVSGSKPACTMTKANFSETECTKEVCDKGKKVWINKDIKTACPTSDMCYLPLCYNGKCEYVKKDPDGDDPCTVYTCDPATGNFSETPKCYDGLFCTIDYCDVFGECSFEPIKCEERLMMAGYPCFEARCKEEEDNFRCVRKLRRNAYIDVCGNCIDEKKESSEVFSSDSDSASSSSLISTSWTSLSGSEHDQSMVIVSKNSSEDEVDLLECTGAPPRPILAEGLAAASIGLIVVAAVVIGAGIAASGIIGTKILIDRARQANNQTAHINPLYEGNCAEMINPAFAEAV